MLDLLLIGCHSLPDETGRIGRVLRECGMEAGGIPFVSSQDTRMVTELIEHRTAMAGYRVECLLHFCEEKTHLNALLSQGVRYAAMTTRYFRNVYELHDIMQYLRRADPRIRIVVGGGFFRSAASKLEPGERRRLLELLGADYYLFHDDCAPLVRSIVEARFDVQRLAQIPHLIWRETETGPYRSSAAVEGNRVLNFAPLAWEEASSMIPEITSLKTTVSCPFSCSFCAVKNKTDPFQTLPLEVVRQNILRLMRLGRTQILHFTDETINLPKARFHELLHMLIELNSGFSWYSFCRCEYVDEETVALMKRSGCMAVLLGLESGNDGLLREMNKEVTAEGLRRTHRLYQQAGILTIGFFIVGFPGETPESVWDTMHFIEECRPDFYRLHAWECETGTAIWERRSSLGLRLTNGMWSHSTMDLRKAREYIAHMQAQIAHSVSIDRADFSFALQMIRHGFSPDEIKGLFRRLNAQPPSQTEEK